MNLTHHYVCLETGKKECTTVAYEFNIFTNKVYYIELKNGDTLENALNKLLSNGTDSFLKYIIEDWYERNLIPYNNKLEDTIYCNDRSVIDYGGFEPNKTGDLLFKGYNINSDLSCSRIQDQFSTLNNDAKLKYKIGLLTFSEVNLLNYKNLIPSSEYFWTMTPRSFFSDDGQYNMVFNANTISYSSTSGNGFVGDIRPVISLKPNITYTTGDGSTSNPYVIDTE